MIWLGLFLVVVVMALGIATVAAVQLSFARYQRRAEAARVAYEVRRAELRLHQIARDAFEAMLEESRRHQRSS